MKIKQFPKIRNRNSESHAPILLTEGISRRANCGIVCYADHMAMLKIRDMHTLTGDILRLESELAAKRAKLNALVGSGDQAKVRRPRVADELRLKCIAWLESTPFQDHSISDVAQGVGEPDDVVGKALYNAYRVRSIRNPRRGKYQALEKEAPIEETS